MTEDIRRALDAMTEDIRRALDEARKQPGFLDRISERVKEDVAILDALALADEKPWNVRPTDEAIAQQAAMTEAYYADPDA
jgi:hypothetical protein